MGLLKVSSKSSPASVAEPLRLVANEPVMLQCIAAVNQGIKVIAIARFDSLRVWISLQRFSDIEIWWE